MRLIGEGGITRNRIGPRQGTPSIAVFMLTQVRLVRLQNRPVIASARTLVCSLSEKTHVHRL
jgi:hypothetical protein